MWEVVLQEYLIIFMSYDLQGLVKILGGRFGLLQIRLDYLESLNLTIVSLIDVSKATWYLIIKY